MILIDPTENDIQIVDKTINFIPNETIMRQHNFIPYSGLSKWFNHLKLAATNWVRSQKSCIHIKSIRVILQLYH